MQTVKRALLPILAFVMAVIVPLTTVGSTISGARYSGRVVITNNSTAASNISTVFSLNSTELIAGGMLAGNGSDVAMRDNAGNDIPFSPGVNGAAWAVFVTSIGSTTTQNAYVYTGNASGGLHSYFPGAAGMNTTDNASLELGNNFTIKQTGFIDTTAGANKTLVHKETAFTTNITGTGNISSIIIGSNTSFGTLTPTGNISASLSVAGAANGWQAVLANDGNTSIVYNAAPNTTTDLYSVNTAYLTGNESTQINSVSVYFVGRCLIGNTGAAVIRVGTNATNGAAQTLNNTWVTYNSTWLLNPNTGRAWTWGDIQTLSIGVQLVGSASTANAANCTQVYAVVYTPVMVTAQGITSGNHSVNTTADGTNLYISVDGVLKSTASLIGASVTNNANPYQFCTANTTPYLTRHQIWVGGVLRQDISWQYASVFADASGNGNSAVPTFRTATSNANVTANLTEFANYQVLPSPPVVGSNSSWHMFGSVPTPPANMYSELNLTFIGSGIVTQVASDTETPIALVIFIYCFGLAILLGILAFIATTGAGLRGRLVALQERGTGHKGSLAIMSMVIFGVLMYFTIASSGVMRGWILIPFGFKAFALLILEKAPSVVG